MLFRYLLKSILHDGGSLRLITADGKSYDVGDGATPRVAVKLHRKSLEWSLGLDPHLKIGEAYTDGSLTIEQGTLRDFLRMLLTGYNRTRHKPFIRSLERLHGYTMRARQFNPLGRARRNVAYHYDLPDQLYSFFLDPDRQYSSGYYTDGVVDLGQAQLDKKRHLAAKLLLDRPGLRVLDIGSGWGGLGLYLAREAGCRVTGVTLSVEQFKFSRQRALNEGLNKSCRFELRDYRQESGPYDRIVSVGMFEHVGKKNYDEFFSRIRDLLADDGICVLSSTGRFCEPGPVNAFIRKHIFPGTDVPTLAEVLAPVERAGLYVTDTETLRLHYAETLKQWHERFRAHREEVVALYGEQFYRKWEFYLVSCEMGFRDDYLMVFEMQLSKRLETVPLTRDYIYDWERSHTAEVRRNPYRPRSGRLS